ncbi:hypothetical protein MAPG_06581 [Magnaporthiopsis poae ATCC 64411]|uniref:Karyogamy protein n=1 Tax=Magnaporthiopsis poae (strain ATCC 64411 / 73-15) TaxID=644358 RepID=A0A0C4E2E5_MAGP6|nr:hypothetical protein MAPG_06581 [Magnaporthiopsis poae ATCC 64411]
MNSISSCNAAPKNNQDPSSQAEVGARYLAKTMHMPPSTCASSSPRELAPNTPAATAPAAAAPAAEPATCNVREGTRNSSTTAPEHWALTVTAGASDGAASSFVPAAAIVASTHSTSYSNNSNSSLPTGVGLDIAELRFPNHHLQHYHNAHPQSLANEQPAQPVAANIDLQHDLAWINNKNYNSHNGSSTNLSPPDDSSRRGHTDYLADHNSFTNSDTAPNFNLNITSATPTHAGSTDAAPAVLPVSVNPPDDGSSQASPADAHTAAAARASSSPSPSASPPVRRRVSARKPSPGLAARLKALGFGGSRKQSPPPSGRSEVNIGRLPEDQIRQLDQGHQAGSEATVVERRGRPWKGALVRIPSTSSLKAWPPKLKPGNKRASEASEDAGPSPDLEPQHMLPEIQVPSPLEMDTNKFRLPDHTNGNGTKAQPETRKQHVARGDATPPMSPGTNGGPPPPPPKDTPPLPPSASATTSSMDFSPDSYFNPLGLQRTGSIYTLSRASFANQLAQLTSLQLPDAESLSGKLAAITTAQAAARALIGAAEQIRNWISKAAEVIGGLDSEDDVEWAAAGGREGLEEVESAINRFEGLIKVYLSAIEDLNSRPDIASVAPDDLQKTVMQMDSTTKEWAGIHDTLRTVKRQVEIAMEWEELWNMVLGDIQNEMEELGRLVFEMEERRHKSIMAGTGGADSVDIGDLETIVEETPPAATRLQAKQNRFSLPVFPPSPSSPPVPPSMSQEDSRLLALFARMQPLRASLDFLPMRLSAFQARANEIFPTACDELEMRRMGLDNSYRKLEKDAENLRRELGEDRWVLVFRGAGRQAQKMYESVERSMAKLKEAVDAGVHLTNPPMMGKKIESYEAKKTHYGPAVERVLSIIDRGIRDRLTVNGEILRLHTELQAKWEELKDRLREMDSTLEEVAASKKGQQLRDSISSMLSNDRSTLASGHDTPQSSPPSSVIMSSLGVDMGTPTNQSTNKRRSSSMGSHLPQPSNRRSSTTVGALGSNVTRKPVSRLATTGSLTVPSRDGTGSVTPQANRHISRPPSTIPGRPRWSMSTTGIDTGHNFKPLQPDATPSPQTSASKLPLRSPLGRAATTSPMPDDTPPKSVNRMSFRERLASPGPYSQLTLSKPRLTSQTSLPSVGSRRVSMPPEMPDDLISGSQRSASSLASIRRSSLFPSPRSSSERVPSAMGGRSSPQALAGARAAMRRGHSNVSDQKPAGDSKPRWRF